MRVLLPTLVILISGLATASGQGGDTLHGVYFPKKTYVPAPLPEFADSRDQLPAPVLDGNPEWVDMYWRCWEIAFRGLKQPPPGSPLVANWLDEAFSANIFQWDTIFMMLFARYAHPVFPAIESLDNFYCRQLPSGFIGREIRESDGRLVHFDFDGGLFAETGWKNAVNPPLFGWAEVASWRLTGDASRFELVIPVLERYAEWLDRDGDPAAADWEANGRRSAGTAHGLYWNTPLGSGMDNTPRPAERGSGWVEMSAQMVMLFDHLALMCETVGDGEKAARYRARARDIAERINAWCWDEADGFYYDVRADGTRFRKKTSGGFWPLLAGVASEGQAARLVAHLENPDAFWRPIVFPTLAADEPEYRSDGGYWLGGVWAPTNVMIIKGLERYGYEDLAAQATERYLAGMHAVFADSGTVYENYAPDHLMPGRPAKADFVGWSGCGPIQLLLEQVMGLRPDAAGGALTWRLRRTDRHGVQRLVIGDAHVSLACAERSDSASAATLTVESSAPLRLRVIHPAGTRDITVPRGRTRVSVP